MNYKVKKGIFWGGMIASMILVIHVIHYLFGGLHALASGRHGHGGAGGMGMGQQGGFRPLGGSGPLGGFGPLGGSSPLSDFGPHHVMGYQHHGFSWLWFLLILILGIAVIVVAMKWLRRKAKETAMQQFIDTSIMNSHRPISNQSANVLDQWEKSLVSKKERN